VSASPEAVRAEIRAIVAAVTVIAVASLERAPRRRRR
jgi:hypothetical protein